MVVIDCLNERLDLAALCLSSFRHAAGDLRGVPFNAGDEGVRKRMCLGTGI